MTHLPDVIRDLGLLLVVASVVTVIFRAFRQPPVLGYILAGIIVGPHFAWFPTVADPEKVQVWADIGIIFLLFGLGLEFNLRRLIRVGGPASITGSIEITLMAVTGYLVGELLGWSRVDSLFLGGVLAISSTTIILRTFEELGLKSKGFAQLVFGVLIIEDIVAVLLLVLLSTVAIRSQFSGVALVAPVLKMTFLLVLWFVSGIFLLPSLFRQFRSHINEETLVVVSVGLCFVMVMFSSDAGLSSALGAFIMGSILSETPEGHRIENLIRPVRDLFAAVFFVSVGMLIDPKLIVAHIGTILLLSTILIVGKIISVSTGALVSGQTLRVSVRSGFSMAQIGEFALIIAGLGQSLKVTSDFLYPVVVGISTVTAFTTPLTVRAGPAAHAALLRLLPQRILGALDRYASSAQSLSRSSDWRPLIQSYLVSGIVYTVLISSIFIASSRWLPSLFARSIEDPALVQLFSLLVAIILAAPFIWGLLFSRPQWERVRRLWEQKKLRAPILVLEGVRMGVAAVLFLALTPNFIDVKAVAFMAILILILFFLIFSRNLGRLQRWFESRLQHNFQLESADSAVGRSEPRDWPQLVPWEAHVARLIVPQESKMAGQNLEQVRVRERFGVSIAMITRGKLQIPTPQRFDRLFPFDELAVIGTDEQIEDFRRALDVESHSPQAVGESGMALESIVVDQESPLVGRTLRNSGLREEGHSLVVGLERGSERQLNPGSETEIQVGDVLWLVGDRDVIQELYGSRRG